MHFIIKIHILYLTERETKIAFKLFKAFIDYVNALASFKISLVITLFIYISCPFSACATESFFHL